MKTSPSHPLLILALFFSAQSAVHAFTPCSLITSCVPSIQIKPLSLTPTLQVYPTPKVVLPQAAVVPKVVR